MISQTDLPDLKAFLSFSKRVTVRRKNLHTMGAELLFYLVLLEGIDIPGRILKHQGDNFCGTPYSLSEIGNKL